MNRSRKSKSTRPQGYQSHLRQAIGKYLPHKGLALISKDKRVRWTDRLLVIAAVLLSWSKRSALTDAFDDARQCVVAMYLSRRRPGQTAKGFFKALQSSGPRLVTLLTRHLQSQTIQRAASRWRTRRWVAMAADGSRVECPRTAANEEAFGCAGRKKTGPQQQLTTIFHVVTGLLWDYRRGAGKEAERTHLRDMLPGLPKATLLLMDAGFTGYNLLQSIRSAGHDFIVRVGSNVTLLTGLGYDVETDGSAVWLWPLGQQRLCPPMRLRKVEFTHKGKKMCLLTSVLCSEELSDAEVKRWYRLRWSIEVQYRNLKQTMQHRKLLSDSPQMARAELDWAVIGLWLLELMLVGSRRRRRSARYSVAGGLRVVRRAMICTGRVPAGGLDKQLRSATQDSYVRHKPKKARDWPHKKKDPPCGMPKLRMATVKELQQTQAFHAQKISA